MTDRLAALLPYPRSVRPQPGGLQLDAVTPITAGPGAQGAGAAVRRVLAALPWSAEPWPAERGAAEPGTGSGQSPGPGPAAGEITVDVDSSLPAEGYRLRIGPSRVRLTAGGEAGAFYAAQTVRQLLPDEAWRAAPVPGPPWQLPCAEIDDAPALPWRGGHLDVARHFFAKNVLLNFIDMLAAHKLNRFHLHLTDDQGWLRPDIIVMAWRGAGIARRAAEAGHDVIAVPVVPTYFDYAQADDEREPLAIGEPVTLQDVAAFAPGALVAAWPGQAGRRLVGTQFQLWTEYIPDGRALEYMAFPRACALADVAWSGGPAHSRGAGRWPERLAAHLDRLDAAGVGYRPLDGPRPWQQGGTGARGHRAGYRAADVTAHLDEIARQRGMS